MITQNFLEVSSPLKQGIATGAKHAVPLANILLSFIMIDMLNNNPLFDSDIKLWKRFIDDGVGVFNGSINDFLGFFRLLQESFRKFDLEITCDTDTHTISENGTVSEKQDKYITFLDVEVYKKSGTVHSREHRKDTSASSYLNIKSAHPRHTFSGIVKSQLLRVRRLCSLDEDFENSVVELKKRCMNSGYSAEIVSSILNIAPTLIRTLSKKKSEPPKKDTLEIRLVVLAGTAYESQLSSFACRMNSLLPQNTYHINIVKSTFPSLSRLLFNNNDKCGNPKKCNCSKCELCKNETLLSQLDHVTSSATGYSYPVDSSLSCTDGGIYVIKGACDSQYTGKTVHFSTRSHEHFSTSKSSAIYQHKQKCNACNVTNDFEMTLVENYHNRGKYCLSEREYLWNSRIKGTMNVQKTLKAN